MGDAVLDLIVNLKDTASGPLAGLREKASGLTAPMAAIGVAGVAAMAAVATAAVGAISATLAWSEKLDGLGDVLGTTGEESAALTVAIQHVGGDVEKITGQMSFFQKGLVTAKGELGPTGIAAKQLGIDVQGAAWKAMGASDQLALLATKVNALPDGLEKSKLMMQLFGKSGKDMSDVMGALANGGMAEALAKAKEWGLVLDEEAIAANLEFNRSLNDLGMMVQGVGVSIGSALMPFVIPMMNAFMAFGREHLPAVREALKGVAEWLGGLITGAIPLPGIIRGISDAFTWLKGVVQDVIDRISNGDLSGVFGVLAYDIATAFGMSEENANKFADAIEKTLDDIIGWVTSNWARFTEGVLKVVGDVKSWVDQNWPTVRDGILGAFTSAYDWVTQNWPAFRDGALKVLGDVRDWISTTWTNVSGWITQQFSDAKTWVDTNWPLFKDAVTNTLGDVRTWIETNWPIAVAGLQQAFVDAKTWVDTNWPAFRDKVTGVLSEAKAWVDQNWPAFRDGVQQVIDDVVKYAQTNMPKVRDAITTALTEAKDFWQKNGTEITGFVSTNWNNIIEIYSTSAQIILTIQRKLWGESATDANAHGINLTGIISGAWTLITLAVTNATELVKGILKAALALMNGDTKGALEIAKSTWEQVFANIKAKLGLDVAAILSTITTMLSTAVGIVKSELAKIANNFTTAFNDAVAAIRAVIDDARRAGADLVGGILSGISSRIGGAEEAILGPIRSAVSKVESTIAGLWSTARQLASFVSSIVFPRAPAPTGGTGGNTGAPTNNGQSVRNDSAFIGASARGGDVTNINVTIITMDAAGASREMRQLLQQYGRAVDARVRFA